MSKNLWGDIEEIDVKTPYSILMEQANIIKDITRGLLLCDVRKENAHLKIKVKKTESDQSSENLKVVDFQLYLYIIAPILNNYQYRVTNITYRMPEPYPAYIGQEDGEFLECPDENSFEENLGKILSSPKVRRAISGLMNQIRAEQSDEAKYDIPF